MAAIAGKGKNDAFTLVEFMDYQCPPCRATQPKVRAALQQNPGLQFMVRNMPLPMHPNAVRAATAAEAARQQNKFEPMHDALISGGSLDEAEIKQIAKKVGLNAAQFAADREKMARQRVDADVKTAGTLHIDATPTFLLCSSRDGKVWQLNSFDQIKDLVK